MIPDKYFGIAAEEIAQRRVDKDLFARAFAAALGDAEKAKAIYIGIRAERLALSAAAAPAVTEETRDPNKPLPKPEDFSDPAMAEAVRSMLAALACTGKTK